MVDIFGGKDMLNKKISSVFFYSLLLILGISFLSFFIKNSILFGLISVIGIYLFTSKVKIKNFSLFLFIYSFIVRLIAVLLLKTPIESDFKTLYDASINLLNNDLSFNVLQYFKLWGYQTGQVVYQAFLLSIWNNVLIIKIVNALISSGTVALIYLISKELFREKTARIVSLLYSLFLFPLLFNAVLSNQILSTFLTVLGIYLLFSKRFDNLKNWIRYPLIGIILGMANVIRPEGIVILTTLIVFLLITMKKKEIKSQILKGSFIFLGYYFIVTICSILLIFTNVSPIGLSNKDSLWKFVLGFNHETVGMYDINDEWVVGNHAEEIKLIKDRTIGSIEKLPILFIKKTRNFWFSSDIYWSNNYLNNEEVNILGLKVNGTDINELLISYNTIIYYLMYGLLFLGLYKTRKEEKNNLAKFLSILTCVYIGVYLLIEIMPRYAYLPQVGLFILSGFGIDYLLNLLELKRKHLS